MTDCCETCRFWLALNPADVWRGKCRRYAPRAAHQWDGFLGEAVIAVADILSRKFNMGWPKGVEGEVTETRTTAEFPHTYDDDWCGEFQPNAGHPSRRHS